MSEIDSRVAEVQAAYEQAIKNGEIDPRTMSIERYADVLADDVEYKDAVAVDVNQEISDSRKAVATLMRGDKKSVLSRWFGKK